METVRLSPRWFEGKTALITQAASAIGQAFAEALAQRGTHLLLVDCAAGQLDALAATLSTLHVVQVDLIAADLGREGAAQCVHAAVGQMGRTVDILVVLAGEDLLRAFLPTMLEKERGAIIQIAAHSLSAAGRPSLSAADVTACRSRGVRVLAVCQEAGRNEALNSHLVVPSPFTSPEQIAARTLHAVLSGHSSVRANLINVLLARVVWRALHPHPLRAAEPPDSASRAPQILEAGRQAQ